jgi:hypothetical protein
MHRPDCNSLKSVGEFSLTKISINTFQTGHCKIQDGFHCRWCHAAARRPAPIGVRTLNAARPRRPVAQSGVAAASASLPAARHHRRIACFKVARSRLAHSQFD